MGVGGTIANDARRIRILDLPRPRGNFSTCLFILGRNADPLLLAIIRKRLFLNFGRTVLPLSPVGVGYRAALLRAIIYFKWHPDPNPDASSSPQAIGKVTVADHRQPWQRQFRWLEWLLIVVGLRVPLDSKEPQSHFSRWGTQPASCAGSCGSKFCSAGCWPRCCSSPASLASSTRNNILRGKPISAGDSLG
jgi:hypothetical protein